jgi:hypothetical protein
VTIDVDAMRPYLRPVAITIDGRPLEIGAQEL